MSGIYNPTTPLMKQYADIRQQYPDALLLFQVGDFYELFFEDAKKAAAFLGITLTARGKNNGEPIPLCGVPVHALEFYLAKLVRGGFHVAICDQLEEAKPGTVVKRGVTQVLTPGTLTDGKLLDAKSASYLLSWYPHADYWGLVFGELLTAQLFATVLPAEAMRLLETELSRFLPDEVIMPPVQQVTKFRQQFSQLGYAVSLNEYDELDSAAQSWMTNQFPMQAYTSVQKFPAMENALVNFFWYLKRNQSTSLMQFKDIQLYQAEDFLILDAATQRNLELIKNNQDGGRKNTLFALLDEAATPMGSRTIKKWLVRPLLNKEHIIKRQNIVQQFIENPHLTQQIRELLMQIGDLERVVGRIALMRAQASDYISLTKVLTTIPTLCELLNAFNAIPSLKKQYEGLDVLKKLLTSALNDDTSNEWIINKGFDQQLDYCRELVENSHQILLDLEKKEQKRTGINSLKIRYNQIYGYYIEVTKVNLALVPDDYIRNQTLVGKERFTTIELKQCEQEMMAARLQVDKLEQEVFEHIKKEVSNYISQLRNIAQTLAYLDGLLGFAQVAYNRNYIRPAFNDKNEIKILNGKHPVIEQKLGNRFIPNDIQITDQERLLIITGPNMGGKSTYLRQVALLCLMAQCGAFVPAESVNVPILDRIFTRIGAGDNVADGKSTFLVEMEETAGICSYATKNSLVILDEVGRGTSTFDGLAIAQAVVEYLYKVVKARCLFATHYHELTKLDEQYQGIISYHAASKKTNSGILLLYKILKGAADGSFGIEVARLAQLPAAVIERADMLLHNFTVHKTENNQSSIFDINNTDINQENQNLKERITELEAKLNAKGDSLNILHSLDLNDISPKKALDLLWLIKEKQ
ncbi:MAG: DNA mismatch repair protein MutS [Candidatus Babeliales bacterium]